MEHLILVSALLLLLFISVFANERSEDIFYVKPGAGTLSVQAELKKYLCKFSYSAQGGTHERHPLISFLQDFKLELTGPMVSIKEVDIKNSQRDNLSLGKDEYQVEKNSVSSVPGKFKNHLEKVAVYSPLSHDDL
ncbi:unnamed protein product [Candidula unifasciata]|uniref:Uncharacterized protein n=1 Tax=Candidula unifasciata TaxID=100452 RepID=A0A8S3YT49_9EUPU|nr:unnamed protein product [Candidula unifasciata]